MVEKIEMDIKETPMQTNLPAWNNETEYKGLGTPDFDQDFEAAAGMVRRIQEINGELQPWLEASSALGDTPRLIRNLQEISGLSEQAAVLLWNVSTFVNCELSVDAKNAVAQKCQSRVMKAFTEFSTALKPYEIFLTRCDQSILDEYLKSEQTRPEAFLWREKRKMKDLLLTPAEEMTITQFKQFALHGWGELYDQISGSLKVNMPSKGVIGAAEAAGYLRNADPILRREAWEGLQAAWKVYEDPCAAILNNLAGCRHEEYKKRSHTREIDFLEFPLMDSKIERATLDAMMSAVESRIEVPRRALQAMASCLGKSQLDPWDLLAPSPRAGMGQEYPFDKGISLIRAAFAGVDESMGRFVDTMVENSWIEARVLPNKKPGAYCTGFAKSRTPRVFQTYMGSLDEVSTLAHELGHAYHSWVMRDLPFVQMDSPMTLAETASIFAETVMSDRLAEVGDEDTKFAVAWADASDAVGFLVNIPARFDFEKSFYQARLKGALSPEDLGDLTDKAWRKWYGQEISETERQYWMTKLHFSISGVSFYNFPYTFGYLFSLGIYAKRAELGADFSKAYVEILRDTGRMTAEEVIAKHLGADIREPAFWLASIDIVEKKIARFEKLLAN